MRKKSWIHDDYDYDMDEKTRNTIAYYCANDVLITQEAYLKNQYDNYDRNKKPFNRVLDRIIIVATIIFFLLLGILVAMVIENDKVKAFEISTEEVTEKSTTNLSSSFPITHHQMISFLQIPRQLLQKKLPLRAIAVLVVLLLLPFIIMITNLYTSRKKNIILFVEL